MGRERYNWSSTRRADRESPGCMGAVLQLFDFHQFQFSVTHQPCFKPNSTLQDHDPTIIQGTEAPRNSLESEEGTFMGVSLLSAELKEEDSYIPVELRLKTKAVELSSSSESCSSPGTKTPNLVARLMGLDLLPDTLSPSSSSSLNQTLHRRYSQQDQNGVPFRRLVQRKPSNSSELVENEVKFELIGGSHSLPETPRISSARRSDVDSRLSLQINKENVVISDEFDYLSRVSREQKSRKKKDWRFDEENRSPSHYSRQIVQQVKENLSRKVGRDITNTPSRRWKSTEGDVLTLKSKKQNRLANIGQESSPSNHSTTPSCSPRLRFLENKSKPVSASQDQISKSPRPLSKPHPPLPPPPQQQPPRVSKDSSKPKPQPLPKHQTIEKCKKASCERFTQRRESSLQPSTPSKANLKISDKKCKKTPLSNDVVAVHKTQSFPSFQTSTQSRQQPLPAQASKPNSLLPSCSSRTPYNQSLYDRDDSTNRTGTVTEFRWYVTEILKRTGIYRHTLVSFTRWFSPSHPLDPSIFHLLEHSTITLTSTGFLKHRWNRKLIFNLVNEILVEILKPHINMRPWVTLEKKISHLQHKQTRGDHLLQRLCYEIRSFPSANCQVLQDIDALIETDLPDANVRTLPTFEETDSIVFEIERDILDSLVHETAASFLHV